MTPDPDDHQGDLTGAQGRARTGRPPRTPTQRDRDKVKLLLGLGWSNDRIARGLSITLPTLRKHYRVELNGRDDQRDRIMASLAMALWKGAESGNVAAAREFQCFMIAMTTTASRSQNRRHRKLGKRAQALADAQQPDAASLLGKLMRQRRDG